MLRIYNFTFILWKFLQNVKILCLVVFFQNSRVKNRHQCVCSLFAPCVHQLWFIVCGVGVTALHINASYLPPVRHPCITPWKYDRADSSAIHYKPQQLLIFAYAIHFVDAHTVYFSQASDTFIKKIRQKPIETQNGRCVTNAALWRQKRSRKTGTVA